MALKLKSKTPEEDISSKLDLDFDDIDKIGRSLGIKSRSRSLKSIHKKPVGLIVSLVIVSLIAIAGPIIMFFWAKGVGWEEGRTSGYVEGATDGLKAGNSNSQSEYWRGYEDGSRATRNRYTFGW